MNNDKVSASANPFAVRRDDAAGSARDKAPARSSLDR